MASNLKSINSIRNVFWKNFLLQFGTVVNMAYVLFSIKMGQSEIYGAFFCNLLQWICSPILDLKVSSTLHEFNFKSKPKTLLVTLQFSEFPLLVLHVSLQDTETKGERERERERETISPFRDDVAAACEDGRLFGTFFSALSVYHCWQHRSYRGRHTTVLSSVCEVGKN